MGKVSSVKSLQQRQTEQPSWAGRRWLKTEDNAALHSLANEAGGRLCMITGANSGIGKSAAMRLATMGYSLVMVCRSKERGEAALVEVKEKSGSGSVELMIADLSSMHSIKELASQFLSRYSALHVLVNNAGVVNLRRQTTVDGYETTFATNYLAPFLLTNLLLERLKSSAPARVVNVSSDSHYSGHIDFADLQGKRKYGVMRAYAQSKLAVVLFTHELAQKLAGTGVTVNCLHPGVVATNIWRRSAGPVGFLMRIPSAFMATPSQGAETLVYLASSPDVEKVSGEYFDKKTVKRSSGESYDNAVAKRLWDSSLSLTGLDSGTSKRSREQ